MATNSVITKVTGTDTSTNRIASTFYGTCSTGASTAAKAVTLSDSCVFNDSCLVTGATIHVKFTNSNTHATPTLKVGTATAKQIMSRGTTKAGTTPETSWYAGAVVSFTYDGTYWQMNDHIDAIDENVKQTPYPTTSTVDPEVSYPATPILMGKPFSSGYSPNISDAYAAKGFTYDATGVVNLSNNYSDNSSTVVDLNVYPQLNVISERYSSPNPLTRSETNISAEHISVVSRDTLDSDSAGYGAAGMVTSPTSVLSSVSTYVTSTTGTEYTYSGSYLYANGDTTDGLNFSGIEAIYETESTSAENIILSYDYNSTDDTIELGDCLIANEIDRGGVQLTQAEYDALVQAGTVDANTTYFITDRNNASSSYAAGIVYDNTNSGLDSTNVQGAIDELSAMSTQTSGAITKNSTYINTVERNGWYKVGRLVMFWMTATAKTTWTSTCQIGSGLPAPVNGFRFIGQIAVSGNNVPLRLELDTDGIIKNGYSVTNPTSGQTIEFSGCYISAN